MSKGIELFKPRITAPTTKDPNWIHSSRGGLNTCILITVDSVLPNCVGYSWGRWRELLGSTPTLHRGNAENWFLTTTDGYSRGSTPKLGAVACWRKGKAYDASDGAGHVAIVEDILPDGSIVTSNSNYGGSRFFMRTFKPPYSLGGTYVFQGFIYPPIEFTKQIELTLMELEELAKEVIRGKWGNGADRVSRLETAGYDPKKVQDEVNRLLREKKPETPKTVEELALEVIAGKWGIGADRRDRLTKAGYNYTDVQVRVNQLTALAKARKSVDEVAREVIRGAWGNGKARKDAIIAAGYDYDKIQKRVNQLLR